jgi:hypothetical protein
MANVYVEPRPKGRPEGSHIEDYVVEDHADQWHRRALSQFEETVPDSGAFRFFSGRWPSLR